jgi:hypothetical protein
MNLTATVTLKGPLFEKKITPIVEQAIIRESLHKFEERMNRGGKGVGSKRNTVTQKREELVLTAETTLIRPRTRGTAWQKKNVGIVKAMAPRVLRATALRITEQL